MSLNRTILIFGFLSTLFFSCKNEQHPEVEEGYKRVNGVELYYKIIGQGEPILILHGGPGLDHSYFLPQMSGLGKDFKLIFFDQRFCGRSRADETAKVSLADFVADIEQMRKILNLGKMNLMAHSWGGLLAMAYALEHTESLKSLILINTVAASSELQNEARALFMSRFTEEDSLARARVLQSDAFQNRVTGAFEDLFRISFRPTFHNRSLADSLTLNFPDNFAANGTKLRALASELAMFDIHPSLAKITAPTLIIYGDSDTTPLPSIEKIHRMLPDSRLEIIAQCGHFPFIEAREPFFNAVRNFLKKSP